MMCVMVYDDDVWCVMSVNVRLSVSVSELLSGCVCE